MSLSMCILFFKFVFLAMGGYPEINNHILSYNTTNLLITTVTGKYIIEYASGYA